MTLLLLQYVDDFTEECSPAKDQNSRLNREKLRAFLRHFGEFPDKYRYAGFVIHSLVNV